jgi:hypothetical protein
MRRKAHYVIKPDHLWASIANLARTQNGELLSTRGDVAGHRAIDRDWSLHSRALWRRLLSADEIGVFFRRVAPSL